jgi:tRNA(His) 5'-end guanylyltransferase
MRVPPGMWTVIRVDGRSFSRFTEIRFEKPFDPAFHKHMLAAAVALIEDFDGIYAYTESDEISLLLPRLWEGFDREVEKAVSIAASAATAAFTHSFGEPALFDGRIWVGADELSVIDYFRWRQFDATRCCLNGWCYWTLRKEGKSVSQATRELEGKNGSWKQEMLFQRGMNFNDFPAWQKRGVGIRRVSEQREGTDPRTGATVQVSRRTLKVDEDLPMGEGYEAYLASILAS